MSELRSYLSFLVIGSVHDVWDPIDSVGDSVVDSWLSLLSARVTGWHDSDEEPPTGALHHERSAWITLEWNTRWGYQIENNEVEDFEIWKLITYLDNTIRKASIWYMRIQIRKSFDIPAPFSRTYFNRFTLFSNPT